MMSSSPPGSISLAVHEAPVQSSEGQRVIFLHGAWHAAWVWEHWLRVFAEAGYRAQAPDLRGHGQSPGSYRGARVSDYVADVANLIAGLEEPPVLVGHSFGGLLIQHLLHERTYPAAVLLAPVPGRYPPRALADFSRRHPLTTLRASVRRDLAGLVASPRLAREALFTEATPEDVVVCCQSRLTGADPRLFREMVRAHPPAPKPGTPTLVLAPTGDRSFTPAMQRRHATELRAEFLEIENSGHNLPLEPAWRSAAEAVLDWLIARFTRDPAADGLVPGPRGCA